MEIWKDIKDYEDLYQVSNYGRIKAKKKWSVNERKLIDCETILTPFNNGHNYLVIALRRNTKRKNYYIHRLVADAFIEKVDGKDYINHKDHNRMNNKVENLEWCTQKENIEYSKHLMKHKKNKILTNTGERYIIYRKSNKTYRIIINRKEYQSCKTLEGAKLKRDTILKEMGVII